MKSKFCLVSLLFLSSVLLRGAVPAFQDFNTNQFGTTGNKVAIKSGAIFTNAQFSGAMPFAPTNAKYLLYDNTNAALSAGKVFQAGANVVFTSGDTNIVISVIAAGTNGFQDPGANGLVTRVATNTSVARTIAGTAGEVSVANGDGVLGNPTISSALTAKFLSFTNRAAMEAATGLTDGTPVILKGYYVQGDAPSVIYTYVAGDTSTVDNGSIITNAAGRFKIQNSSGRIDIRNFGVISDVLKIGGSWTNGSTNIVLASAPSVNYVGKKIALRRGNTSVAAEVRLLAADLSGTTITSFTVVSNGQGYINVPTNVLVAGPGSGATTTVVLTGGQVTSITVTGGGTAYTTNSVFKIRSTDAGTTNAPFYTALFTVYSQSSSNLALLTAPTFTANLNATDDASEAYLYSDNVTNFQAAVDYAYANGLRTYIPAGDFATGPVYLNPGQIIEGGGQEIARLHSAATIGFTTFRKSVLAPKNVNSGNGRMLVDTTFGPSEISGFTIDGEGAYQSPLGTDLNNGSFAVFGVNCSAVQSWHIHDMTITNCQGGAIYYGSWTPSAGLSGDWASAQSRNLSVRDCIFQGNWRQAHQMGNVTRLVEDTCRILDSSYGYYSAVVARNLLNGSSIGMNNTYSPEQIDFEANSGGTSGYNIFQNCLMQNKYGKGGDLFLDQGHTMIVGCTIKDCLLGGFTASVPAISTTAQNFDGSAEWSGFVNNFFVATSTNTGAHLQIKGKGMKVIGNTFEGKTGNTTSGNADVSIDGSGYTSSPSYVLGGIIVKDNLFNLYATDGTLVDGTVSVIGLNNNVKDLRWDNTVVAGYMDVRLGTDEKTVAAARMAGISQQEGYAYQTASGGTTDYASEGTTAGLGSQDWTFLMRYGLNTGSVRNGELFRWFTAAVNEFRLYERTAGVSNAFQIDWNPNNTGLRTFYVPLSTFARESFSSTLQFQRPVNLAITKTHGSVYKINVTAGGSGYTASTQLPLTFATGAAAGSAMTSSSGVVTNAYITAASSGYTTNPVVTLTGGGGSSATFTASAGRMDFYLDDVLIFTDYGTDIITSMSTAVSAIKVGPGAGTAARSWYAYGVWNKALNADQIRQALVFGPAEADKWGTPNGTLGCVTYVKFNPGIGFFFEDPSTQAMHVWTGQATTHGFPKRTGQILKHIVTAGAATNSVNIAVAASDAIPANARITSIYAIGQSLGVPSVVVGFDAALANPITTAKTLVAGVTNYLPLVSAYIYGSTNRPVYISTSGASTNDYVINYTLDQGELSGPLLGFQDASSAAAGDVGEILTSAIAVGAAWNMATTVVTNVTSLSLTPGHWLVYGNFNITTTNSTITAFSAGITSTTATIPVDGTELSSQVNLTTTSFKDSISVKPKSFTVATTTPVYLVGVGTFSTANTVGGYGSMIAQRIR